MPYIRNLSIFLAILVVALLAPTVVRADDGMPATLPNGVAAGDATQHEVVLWARSTMTDGIVFTLPGGGTVWRQTEEGPVPSSFSISGLAPNTEYEYSVHDSSGDSVSGRFKTPAALGEYTGLRFGVSGDWRGDFSPYPALSNGVARDLDFFIALGDTVYADIGSAEVPGTAQTLDQYRRKHAEALTDRDGENALTALRADTLFYAMIDDHEIVDDFAGGAEAATDSRFAETEGYVNDTARFENGLQAFEEYYPLEVESYDVTGSDELMDGEDKLYRYRTFGSDAAVFLLDARTFRHEPIPGPADVTDLERMYNDAWTPGRTLVGERQLAELKRDLLHAKRNGITWKFVVVPEPIQIIGPFGASDRFEGYAAERADLLGFIHEQNLKNVVFIAADLHGTLVNNITYRAEQNAPLIQLQSFEITTGPIAQPAVLGPRIAGIAQALGWLSADDMEFYLSLPVDPDEDDLLDDRDDVVRQLLDSGLAFLGEDPIGLEDSPLDVTLLVGDYVVAHTYGWTEFEIDGDSQLTVTTYGIPVHGTAELSDESAVGEMTPEILSQFQVEAETVFGHRNYLPYAPER